MAIQLDVQLATEGENIPTTSMFKTWAEKIPTLNTQSSVCLRIVGENEARALNRRFRNIDKATNVLSFPVDVPNELELNFLGDVVICAPLVTKEAIHQKKDVVSHWAHLLIHGILHLQGYLHDNDEQAFEMETIEIETLQQLGIENPY